MLAKIVLSTIIFVPAMILKQFSSRQPLLLILVPIMVLGILVPLYHLGFMRFSSADYPVGQWSQWLISIPWVGVSILSFLIISGALLSNLLFNKHEFNPTPTYVPALVYSIIATTLSLISANIPLLLALLSILVGINYVLDVFRNSKALAPYFTAGFFFGVAAFCYPPFIALIIGFWICVINTRIFSWREFLLPLLAFVTPFLYWWAWKYWFGQLDSLILFKKLITYNPTDGPDWTDNYTKSFGIIIAITFVLALRSFVFLSDRSSNKARGIKRNFFILSLAIMASAAISITFANEYAPEVILIPITFVAGNWFTNYRYSLIAPFAFYALLISSALFVLHAYRLF